MESFKSEPQFSPFSPRKPSLFLARSCSITLYRTQPIKIELLSYYLTIMVRYRILVRQIGPSESTVQRLQVLHPLCIEFPRAALDLSTPASFPAGFSSMSFYLFIWRMWSLESLTSDSKYCIFLRPVNNGTNYWRKTQITRHLQIVIRYVSKITKIVSNFRLNNVFNDY